MGTRADFYVRSEESMEWLGSIAWDGYPDGIDKPVLKAKSEDEFRVNVEGFLLIESGATFPKDGWPWPWNDSRTTDYSYIFQDGKVMASNFGYELFDPLKEQEESDETSKMDNYFPDMSHLKNVQLSGPRSGLIVLGFSK